MKYLTIIFSYFIFCNSVFLTVNAQEQIDLRLIKQKKIRKSILKQNLHSVEDFGSINAECLCNSDEDISIHTKSFLFPHKLNEVWETYQNIQPKDSWNDKIVSFGLLFEEKQQHLYYINQANPKSQVGQLIYINLHFLHGLFNIAVAHKIVEINEKEKLIRSCYVKDGKSKGTQFIRFYKISENQTKVEHITYYKSDSKFRDNYLYPWLHGKVITEFHGNINHFLTIQNLKTLSKRNSNIALSKHSN